MWRATLQQEMTAASAGGAAPACVLGSVLDALLRFAGVGAGSTLVHYAIMAMLTSLFGVAPLPASQAGFLVGGALSYALNRAFTFRADVAHRRALPRYALACLLGWGVNGGAFVVLQAVVGRVWVAQKGATWCVAAVSFLVQRRLVFGTRGAGC